MEEKATILKATVPTAITTAVQAAATTASSALEREVSGWKTWKESNQAQTTTDSASLSLAQQPTVDGYGRLATKKMARWRSGISTGGAK
jgi:hypothetical protein